MEQLRLVMASARIPTSRIRMPDGIEHFVVVVAALLNVTLCIRKGKGVECREVYPRRGRVNWNRLAFGVGKGRVPEDSSSEAVISEC